MTEERPLTVGDALKGLGETQEAIKQIDRFMEDVSRACVEKPRVLAEMVDATMRLKEHLEADMASLQEAYERAQRL